MSVKIAEYFGQRTDIAGNSICPVSGLHNCPFQNNITCLKLTKNLIPVCAVRKINDDGTDGDLWISCPDRLCATTKGVPLSQYQSDTLFALARFVFGPRISKEEVYIKREVSLRANDSTNYKADYIMVCVSPFMNSTGPNSLIVEMQGGGETTNTGPLTRHLKEWEANPGTVHLNEVIKGVNTLETNAWRRQQEQFLVKGNVAAQTSKSTGMVFAVGTILFDYLNKKVNLGQLPDMGDAAWDLAIIAFKEDASKPKAPGPIPLMIDTDRVLFTKYARFVSALTNQGLPSPEAFKGRFVDLTNKVRTTDSVNPLLDQLREFFSQSK